MKNKIKSIVGSTIMAIVASTIFLVTPVSAQPTAPPTPPTQPITEIVKQTTTDNTDLFTTQTFVIQELYTEMDVAYDEKGNVANITNTYYLTITDPTKSKSTQRVRLNKDTFDAYNLVYLDNLDNPDNATIDIMKHKQNGAYYVPVGDTFVRVGLIELKPSANKTA